MTSAESTTPSVGLVRRALRWTLVNRQTGRLTVAQWPNIPLLVFILSWLALHLFHPKGAADSVVRVLADVALLVWAGDEVIRGVNPFRRMLGLAVIIATLVGIGFSIWRPA